MDYSYEGYYQAVRRLYRFGQDEPVDIYRVLGSTEINILNTIRRKSDMQNQMHGGMVEAMRRRNAVGQRKHYEKHSTEHREVYIPDWLRSDCV
jgi:SNF2 family DNA or RNA helicase